jgi:lipoprotein-releasing system ATP-binding protein
MSRLLEVHNLHKGYTSGDQHLEIISGLSLAVEEGEMGGMDRPDQGSIAILGREISKLNTTELSGFRNETIGFVFQFHHLLPEFSALENVMMPLLIRGISPLDASDPAKALLQDVGLADRMQHRPGELSGGEQQRVALARALVGKPRLLLADEPTGNVDPQTGQAIGSLFRDLHEKHSLTSVIVTHNSKLARICSRVLRLEDGKLIDGSGLMIGD